MIINRKIINRKGAACTSPKSLEREELISTGSSETQRCAADVWSSRKVWPVPSTRIFKYLNYAALRLLLENNLAERRNYTERRGLTHFFKQRAEKRRKSPGYSRFFSPLHLDPAFILGATSTAAVMSISPSSSSSDSTAMPGNKKNLKKKNHLYLEYCWR